MTTSTTQLPQRDTIAEALADGHASGDPAASPYLLTSPMSDGFMIGVYFRLRGLPPPSQLRRSRGYRWVVDGQVFSVDGRAVEPVRAP